MIAITKTTTSWRFIEHAGQLLANEVAFDGDFTYLPDGVTPTMVWDAGLGNVRAMTQPEIDAIPAQIRALKDSALPDIAALRDSAIQAIADINTFLAIASPSNAQLAAEVKAIDQRQRAIIKAVLKLATQALG